MKLRSYLILLCVGMVATMSGLFYYQADVLLAGHFKHLESMHLRSVSEFSKSVIEARKYSLRTLSQRLGRDYDLSRLFLMADTKKERAHLKKYLKKSLRQIDCDIIDVINIFTGRTLFHPGLIKHPKHILSQVRKGNGGFVIEVLPKGLALLAYSPLRIHHESVGGVLLGYYFNQSVAATLLRSIGVKGNFVQKKPQKFASFVSLPVLPSNQQIHTIYFHLRENPVGGANQNILAEVLWVGVLTLLGTILLGYLVLEFGFVRRFNLFVSQIRGGASDLDLGLVKALTFPKRSLIREFHSLRRALEKYVDSLKGFKKKIEAKSRTEAIGKLASQVGHDLASPLTALGFLLKKERLKTYSVKERDLIRDILTRIQEIVHGLREKSRPAEEDSDAESPLSQRETLEAVPTSLVLLSNLVLPILDEKRSQYANQTGVKIRADLEEGSYGIFAKVHSGEMKRILSNIIDNAVQAMRFQGDIWVGLRVSNGSTQVRVRDKGPGIPPSIRSRIFERGVTYGKSNGTGLGLWHAGERIRQWGGKIYVNSVEGEGTLVTLELPREVPPQWHLAEIRLTENVELVIVDDDTYIHSIWQEKTKDLCKTGHRVCLRHFGGLIDFEAWLKKNKSAAKQTLYFLDYDFRDESRTGLDFICQEGLGQNSILVTGHYEDSVLKNRCTDLGVRMLPKVSVAQVPIRWERQRKPLVNRTSL